MDRVGCSPVAFSHTPRFLLNQKTRLVGGKNTIFMYDRSVPSSSEQVRVLNQAEPLRSREKVQPALPQAQKSLGHPEASKEVSRTFFSQINHRPEISKCSFESWEPAL